MKWINKNILICLLTLLLIFNLVLVSAQLNINPDDLDNINPDIIKSKAEAKWDYLQKEWKAILLKNEFFAKTDALFTKGNIIFLVLFGEGYSISLILLAIIILWIISLFWIKNLVKSVLGLKLWVCYLLGLASVIILAQIGILRLLVTNILKLIFAPELWWARLFIALFVLVVFILLSYLIKMLEKSFLSSKKKNAENKQKENQEKLKRIVKGAEEFKGGAGI